MAFEVFEKRKRVAETGLPKGVCSLAWTGENMARISISATDSMNGLRDVNCVQTLYDADAHMLGIAKTSVGLKLCRQKTSGIRTVTLPAKLGNVLRKLDTRAGRYYFVDDPRHGHYVIDLTTPVPVDGDK